MVGFGLGIVSSSVHLKLYGIIGKDEDSAPKYKSPNWIMVHPGLHRF